jgi:hypothetical protein
MNPGQIAQSAALLALAVPSLDGDRRSGFRALVGQFVGVVGSARPISRVELRSGKLRFSVLPQWEPGASDPR